MECGFAIVRDKSYVKIEDHEVSQSNHFRYLGSIIHMARLKRMLSVGQKQVG